MGVLGGHGADSYIVHMEGNFSRTKKDRTGASTVFTRGRTALHQRVPSRHSSRWPGPKGASESRRRRAAQCCSAPSWRTAGSASRPRYTVDFCLLAD